MSEKRLCGLRRVPHAQSLPPIPVSGPVLVSAGRLEGDVVLGEPGQRVDRPAASRVKLEVQVRAGGKPPVAHASDPLTSGDAFPNGHVESLHMTVDGNRAIIALDADPLPETGGRAGVDDSAAHRREDRGTHDVGDVDTRVEGSPAHAGTGGEGAFSGLDHRGRAGSALVLGPLGVVLDVLVQLLVDVGDRLEFGDRENLRCGLRPTRGQGRVIGGLIHLDGGSLWGDQSLDLGRGLQGDGRGATDAGG